MEYGGESKIVRRATTAVARYPVNEPQTLVASRAPQVHVYYTRGRLHAHIRCLNLLADREIIQPLC